MSAKYKTKNHRRPNGSGGLYRRNGWYYYKTKRGNKVFSKSCHTRDRAKAEKVREEFATAYELPKNVRLAAIAEFIKPPPPNPDLMKAIGLYCNSPKNLGQSERQKDDDLSRYMMFIKWLHGNLRSDGNAKPIKPAHPECERLNDITTEIASEFIAQQRISASPATINRYLRVLKRVWDVLKIEHNPWAEFTNIKEVHQQRRSFTRGEVSAMIDAAEGEMKYLFTVGPYTGLRMYDCTQLKWSDIDFSRNIINLQPRKTALSSRVYVHIPIHPKLKEVLEQQPRNTNSPFVAPGLAALPKWHLSKLIHAHIEKCGLYDCVKLDHYRKCSPTVGFHSFRSFFITELANLNMPLAMVQSIVGHVSPELTQLYYRPTFEASRQYIERL